MQLKQLYSIATKVSSKKSATATFGDLYLTCEGGHGAFQPISTTVVAVLYAKKNYTGLSYEYDIQTAVGNFDGVPFHICESYKTTYIIVLNWIFGGINIETVCLFLSPFLCDEITYPFHNFDCSLLKTLLR